MMETMGVELGVNEWKKGGVGKKAVAQQRIKSILINKAILVEISKLSLSPGYSPRVIAMDWVGSKGILFQVHKVDDVYSINHICDLKMPEKLSDLKNFESTLNGLIIWRNHHVALHGMVKQALNLDRQIQLPITPAPSPKEARRRDCDNTCIVPSKKTPQQMNSLWWLLSVIL
ncbi:hypothetical protein BDF22DRAFT_774710 [Syncephalis plumigaleata]|nr:hypothetical protein BDF22DRAFT_774710 [Syncephalis plumigaleata]